MIKFIRSCTNSLIELWIWLFGTLAIAALLFSLFEGIDYWKAFYWACVTATSTGYGDISPKTVPGQILAIGLMFLSLFFILPLMIARVINAVVENHDAWTHEEQIELLDDVREIKDRVVITEINPELVNVVSVALDKHYSGFGPLPDATNASLAVLKAIRHHQSRR